jgi:hypothetical protein
MIAARIPGLGALGLALVFALTGCDTGSGLEGGGTLEGTVVLEGTGEVGSSPHLLLYSSPTDFDLRQNGARVDLTGGGFPFDFRIENLDPGTYYLEGCFAFGCAFYSNQGDAGISVSDGQTTTITLTVLNF